MSDTIKVPKVRTTSTTYYAVANIGHWCHVDAECEMTTFHDDEPMYGVTFILVDDFGTRANLGSSCFWPGLDEPTVCDEDANCFADISAAILYHARDRLRIELLPAQPQATPPEHETMMLDTPATAFGYHPEVRDSRIITR